MSNSGDKRKEKLESRILSCKGGLFDCELLEYILYPACKEESREVAERLIDLFNSIGKVINTDLYDLKSVTEMNYAAVASILCVKETIDRILKGKVEKLSIIDNIEKLLEYLKATMGQLSKESLRVICLDQSNHLIHEHIQDIGTINTTPFYIRDIVERVLLVKATSAIIVHNHPGGSLEPSEEDEKNTRELERICDGVKIKLIDHIIITQKGHFSFYDNGLM